MLTGKLVRVRHVRNRVVPLYVDPTDEGLLALADQLLAIYRSSPGRTRGELAADLTDLIPEGPRGLLPAGLAKLLEDRCEFEVEAEYPPDALREAVFRAAARARSAAAAAGSRFDRGAVLEEVARSLSLTLTADLIERSLFADLRDQQRVRSFADLSADRLLHRYNVALAQAIVLRSVALEVRVWAETPARFRQLFRAIKFHRLIGTIQERSGGSYVLRIDGPLSLFSATSKYGLQLALFLPSLLHCKAFELQASVRWGSGRKEKLFELSSTDGLRSHLPDFGVYMPPEVQMFAESFPGKAPGWSLSADPHPISFPDGVWVPDFELTHDRSGQKLYLELFGFWRKADIDAHLGRLRRNIPGRFLICVGDPFRAERDEEVGFGDDVYRYRRVPIAEEVVRHAAGLLGVS